MASGYRLLVVHVGCDRVQTVVGPKKRDGTIRMPGCDPHGGTGLAQMMDDPATEKPSSTEDGDSTIVHDSP